MECIVAHVDHIKFDIEVALDEQYGALPLPFPGMDKCPFLHIDPESKIKDCPWYDRGFCRHGPHCRHRHVRRVLCTNYLAGVCPDGPTCKYMHPRFELPAPPDQNLKDQKKPPVIICHFCGEHGHKAVHCSKITRKIRRRY
ncbi:cleavage and polyadenylation specificity factor subunit 4-related [Holotrichia oblita]|uniref:Cleavage and polyadenylation specificity factor subunit 4-related n=1 Tax=Holotrichia oblita TaxID=644536 RepID=A0ACB9TZ85_HOLOL|nr:cleavage and polyadenylation specificity factor subunit 4-related [Holotrichia oblita]